VGLPTWYYHTPIFDSHSKVYFKTNIENTANEMTLTDNWSGNSELSDNKR